MSLKCVPVKHESNTQGSEIEPLIMGMKHQRNAKSMKTSLLFAQKQTFSKKVLRRRSGVSLATISARTSHATAVGARLFKLLMKNLAPGPWFRQICWKTKHFSKICANRSFGSAVPDQLSDLALVRGSDDGSVQSPNSLK